MELGSLFCNGMVLQREKPIPVWGWATPGETVAVSLAGTTATAVADAEGAWRVTLPALDAGGPYTLTVQGTAQILAVQDVLVGEVWVCSGQSNMEFAVASLLDAEAQIAAAGDDALRMFTVAQRPAFTPERTCVGAWASASPATVGAFSAVAYHFARRLRQELGVPVGLINSSFGGTFGEVWMSLEGLRGEPACTDLAAMATKVLDAPNPQQCIDAQAVRRQQQDSLPIPDIAEFALGWASSDLPDADWPHMALPSNWQDGGVPHNGVVWFRLTVDIPAAWEGKPLQLGIGMVDKAEITFFNGEQVGSLTHFENPLSWNTPRCYTVPGRLVRAGQNVIAVRAFSQIYGAGLIGPRAAMFLECPGEGRLPLHGAWRYRVEHNFGNFRVPAFADAGWFQDLPTSLFNGMVAPLIPYAMRGVLWYQGESNAERAEQYGALFPALIRDWRTHWGQGDFPFYFVQLASFLPRDAQPTDTDWARLREAQTGTLTLPETGMAVTIDIGDAEDVHPKNKQDVGYRLAQWALARTYGFPLVPSGPLFTHAEREGHALRVHFTYIADGLLAKDGPLTGFALAGADRQFVWADARIDGDTVLVSSPEVPEPAAVRYAWADNPACNLYNSANLPASPFRSDDWAR